MLLSMASYETYRLRSRYLYRRTTMCLCLKTAIMSRATAVPVSLPTFDSAIVLEATRTELFIMVTRAETHVPRW